MAFIVTVTESDGTLHVRDISTFTEAKSLAAGIVRDLFPADAAQDVRGVAETLASEIMDMTGPSRKVNADLSVTVAISYQH